MQRILNDPNEVAVGEVSTSPSNVRRATSGADLHICPHWTMLVMKTLSTRKRCPNNCSLS